jgi:hypothetical protein
VTPEFRQQIARRVTELQARLNSAVASSIDPVSFAEEARHLFQDAENETLVRWLDLELRGYGGAADAEPLHTVLGVPAAERLVAHVTAYRMQSAVELLPPTGRPFQHFFVEPLPDLVRAREVIRARYHTGFPFQVGAFIALDFRPRAGFADYPMRAEFRVDVLERVTGGFVAALYLQLGSALR